MAMGLWQFINRTGSGLEVSEKNFSHNSPILYDQKDQDTCFDVFLCMMSLLLPDDLVGGGGGGRESYQERTGLLYVDHSRS